MDIKVEVSEDHILRVGQCKPENAITELIWNSIDAGALNVYVRINRNSLGGIDTTEIQDDGCGIDKNTVQTTFGQLGRSLKLAQKTNSRGKPLHGKVGEGRFKAYSLGTKVEWRTKSEDREIIIRGEASKPGLFIVEDIEDGNSGTLFTAINGRGADFKLSADEKIMRLLTIEFAPKLIIDPDLNVYIGGKKLDPKANILHIIEKSLPDPFNKSTVKIVVWKDGNHKEFNYCDSNFHFRAHDELELNTNLSFSIFVASDLVDNAVIHSLLITPDLTDLKELKRLAIEVAKDSFKDIERKNIASAIEDLKRREVYPYQGEAISELEHLERSVFDICTTKIIESIPTIKEQNKDTQILTFQLLKTTIETSPSALKSVLEKVLKLPKLEIEKLSELLEKVKFENLITLGKTVSDRLTFLSGLEQLVLNPAWKKHVYERKQLHKIIEKEVWIFGEQFSLGTSDETLTSVLDYHKELLNHQYDEIEAGENRGMEKIPDLVLGAQMKIGAGDIYEHIVIEIKRPSVKIGISEKGQIENYAMIVQENNSFNKSKTKWTFIAISTDIADNLHPMLKQANREYGQIQVAADGSYQIFIKTWGEIIQAAKGRMEYLKNKLEFQSTRKDGVRYLQEKYPEIISQIEGELVPAVK